MDSPELKAFQAIFITCVILGTSENPQSATSRLLSLPILQWIGRRTYSFYLWQQLFMGLPILFGMENNTLRLAYVTGGTLVCGLISYHLVEGPFIRMGKALLARTS